MNNKKLEIEIINVPEWVKDKHVQKWLGKIGKSTHRNYIQTFNEWLNFIEMTPTEQIEKRVKDLAETDLTKRGFFEDKVIEYKNMLETKEYSTRTVHNMLTSVLSFFSRNRLKLQFSRGDLTVKHGKDKVTREWIPNNSEIRAIYTMASVRDRSLILLLYQSGLSPIDVSMLNIQDLPNIVEHPENEHYYIEIRRQKTSIPQKTCISHEAIYDLKQYLKTRSDDNEALLITHKNQRLEPRFINEALKTLVEKAHPERHKEWKTKNLRDSYNDALLRADLKEELKDSMLGHKRRGARSHYECSEVTIKEAYARAFRYLTINHGTQTRTELRELKEQIKDNYQVLAEEIAQLRKRNELLEKALSTKLGFKIKELYEETEET